MLSTRELASLPWPKLSFLERSKSTTAGVNRRTFCEVQAWSAFRPGVNALGNSLPDNDRTHAAPSLGGDNPDAFMELASDEEEVRGPLLTVAAQRVNSLADSMTRRLHIKGGGTKRSFADGIGYQINPVDRKVPCIFEEIAELSAGCMLRLKSDTLDPGLKSEATVQPAPRMPHTSC